MRRMCRIRLWLWGTAFGSILLGFSAGAGRSQGVLEAAQAGDWTQVQTLLAKNPTLIGARNAKGATILHLAAANGRSDKDVILSLLDRGADIDAGDENRTTPVFWAAQNGRQDIAELLLARGADYRRRDHFETTLLHRAAYGGCPALIEDLLAKGLDPDALEYRGQTPLHWAVTGKRLPVIESLLAGGARVDIRDRFGTTPFISAVASGFLDGAERLAAGGADPNQKDAAGSSALHLGLREGRPDFYRRLLRYGADVDVRDDGGQTPLLIASYYGRLDLAALFLEKGARVDASDEKGRTPLLQAAISGYPALAELLLDRGAEINPRDAASSPSLDLSRQYGNRETAALLASRGGRSNGAAKNSDSAALLGSVLKEGEAVVWNLGHAGWAVKTKSRLLVFDYWAYGEKPEAGRLANGRIDPQEIRGLPVFVFSSHVHFDHFDPIIMTWEKIVPRITYIFGFQPFREARYHYLLDDRQTGNIGGLEIYSVRDGSGGEAGVGFLVQSDGLAVYFGDDYKGRALEPEPFDDLVRKAIKIDLAFLRMDEISRAASTHVLRNLKPGTVFPMHAVNREFLYERQARDFGKESPGTTFVCSLNRGDHYFYRDGKLDRGD
jgi:ankyrin repeat protein/L-ascorbate metabolism protein UlaG (beta-lactamase superfamily)